MVKTADPHLIASKCEAITTLFPYVTQRERGGERDMLDVFLRLASYLGRLDFVWHRIEPLVVTMLEEGSHVSLKEAIILAAPHFNWKKFANGEHLVGLWAAAASEVPYTDDIGQSVVDTLLQIARRDLLRPHIPVVMWSWLDKRPSLPSVCLGRQFGTTRDVVRTVRDLGDIDILKSYLLLVWSEWDHLRGAREMAISLREDFGGIGMWHHREDLLYHLDRILEELGRGFNYLHQHNPSIRGDDVMQMRLQYRRLRGTLLEVHGEAMVILTRECPRLITLFGLLDLHGQNVTQSFRVRSLSPVRSCTTKTLRSLLPHHSMYRSTFVSLSSLRDPSYFFAFAQQFWLLSPVP